MSFVPKSWQVGDLLKLSYLKKITPSLTKLIVDKYSSYNEFIDADLPESLNVIINQGELFSRKQAKPEIDAKKQLDFCESEGIKICTIWDSDYPKILKEIHQAPVLFFYKGTLSRPDSDSISIVGTRKCSNYGKINTRRYSSYFASKGAIVVSGLAYGIDTEAHLGTLESGGITYAVIASGIDKLGPQTAQKNAEKIIESGGAIISTYKCGVRALPPYFLQRNRIISGLSSATLVIESKFKGGSLNTAKFARDQDREVFALPGNITSINSQGTNNLIANGLARLTQSPEDLYKELNFSHSKSISITELPEIKFSHPNEREIYNCLSFEPTHIDDLSEKVDVDISQVLVSLLSMEFAGTIRQLPGKYYIRN